jgi:oxygen-independent coproporphyrinogen-3 oxidase
LRERKVAGPRFGNKYGPEAEEPVDSGSIRFGQELVPRYTRYPTAPHFTAEIGPGTYAFRRSICWYCGCDTSVVCRDERVAVYASAARCEIDLVLRQLERRIQVDQILFGVGTPTIKASYSFVDLIEATKRSFFIPSAADIAAEIDPMRWSTRLPVVASIE